MSVADSPRLGTLAHVCDVVLVVAALAAGLMWALPAAGIGLTLGFVVLGTLLVPGLRFPRPVVFVVVLGCGVVACLDATHDLGIGDRYIPAVVPFFLLALAAPAVVLGSRRPASLSSRPGSRSRS